MKQLMLCIVGALLCGAAATAQETADEDLSLLATSVRQKGYLCSNPRDARPVPYPPSGVRAVWTLRCDEGGYTLTYRGDTGFDVAPRE